MTQTSGHLEKSALIFLYNFNHEHNLLKLIVKKVIAENQCERHKKSSLVKVLEDAKTEADEPVLSNVFSL